MLVQEKLKRIGSVAKESGLPIKTIRYYDELGLLKTFGRTEGNYQLFNSDILACLRFIKFQAINCLQEQHLLLLIKLNNLGMAFILNFA